MGFVQGKDVLLKIYKGGIPRGVACNASCSISIDTDTYETTFLDSGQYRQYIANKHSSVLNGSGPILLGEFITVADVMQWQLSRQLIEFDFVVTDKVDVLRVHGMGYVTHSSIDGTADSLATCDYTIQVNGVITFYSTDNTGSGDDDKTLDPFFAEGGETLIGFEELENATIVYIAREGIGVNMITSGVPNGSQVLYNSSDGTLTFGTPLSAGEWVHVIYQSA